VGFLRLIEAGGVVWCCCEVGVVEEQCYGRECGVKEVSWIRICIALMVT
jgi:hypothetical protein